MAVKSAPRQAVVRERRARGVVVIPSEVDIANLESVMLRMGLITQAHIDDDGRRQEFRAIAAKFIAGVVAEHLDDLGNSLREK